MTTANHSKGFKRSWVTRRLPLDIVFDWRAVSSLTRGDVMLCEVVEPSLHSRLETGTGQRSVLYEGDRLLCVLGGRYATSMLEGAAEIDGEHADLLSASGVCGRVLHRCDKKARPTSLKVLAQAFQNGRAVNVSSFGLSTTRMVGREPLWVLVLGSSMDSGKTTACTSLIHGLSRAGALVGAAKLTGTASARDLCAYRDAGAVPCLDFLDCGWASTAGCTDTELEQIAYRLAAALRAAKVDVAVLEVADGIIQPETHILLEVLRGHLTDPRVIFTARESLAGVAGVERLTALGYGVSAVSGVLTSSPLARREVEFASGLPCIATSALGGHALELVGLGKATDVRPTLVASP